MWLRGWSKAEVMFTTQVRTIKGKKVQWLLAHDLVVSEDLSRVYRLCHQSQSYIIPAPDDRNPTRRRHDLEGKICGSSTCLWTIPRRQAHALTFPKKLCLYGPRLGILPTCFPPEALPQATTVGDGKRVDQFGPVRPLRH
jgi:hypothetical protein